MEKRQETAMKRDPITRKDQAHLIHLLHASGEFSGTRGGRTVSLQVKEDLFGKRIAYRVVFRGKQQHGEAPTVAAAVDELNRLIRHSSAITLENYQK
jgi:hypothetical protein